LETRVIHAGDRIIDAIQVNVHSLRQGTFRQANAMLEIRVIRCGGKEQPKLLASR
jgi:hypothetical protein